MEAKTGLPQRKLLWKRRGAMRPATSGNQTVRADMSAACKTCRLTRRNQGLKLGTARRGVRDRPGGNSAEGARAAPRAETAGLEGEGRATTPRPPRHWISSAVP